MEGRIVGELLAQNVRAYRRDACLTQASLAGIAGLQRTQVSSIELQNANLTCANIEKIACALNVPPMLLLAPPIDSFDYYRTQKHADTTRASGTPTPATSCHPVLRPGDRAFLNVTSQGIKIHLLNR